MHLRWITELMWKSLSRKQKNMAFGKTSANFTTFYEQKLLIVLLAVLCYITPFFEVKEPQKRVQVRYIKDIKCLQKTLGFWRKSFTQQSANRSLISQLKLVNRHKSDYYSVLFALDFSSTGQPSPLCTAIWNKQLKLSKREALHNQDVLE